ncbi:MAG TPA: AzlD domain-containing protein [Clostridiales bacterium]|nr:AzlD domain-containing protein [Clostridiales bacterium]
MKREIFFLIIGMSIVTQLPRILPLIVLTRISMPSIVVRWLKHIPVAVLSALLLPALLLPGGSLSLSLDNTALLSSIPCILVAAKTKNLFLTVLTGIIFSALFQIIL